MAVKDGTDRSLLRCTRRSHISAEMKRKCNFFDLLSSPSPFFRGKVVLSGFVQPLLGKEEGGGVLQLTKWAVCSVRSDLRQDVNSR